MRRALALTVGLAATAWGTTTVDGSPQQATCVASAPAATSVSAAFPNPVVAGDSVVVGVSIGPGNSPVTVSDTLNNLYFPAFSGQVTAPQGSGLRIFYASGVDGGGNAIVVAAIQNATDAGLLIQEYAGDLTVSLVGLDAGPLGPAIGSAQSPGFSGLLFAMAMPATPSDPVQAVGSPYSARASCAGDMTADVSTIAGVPPALFALDGGWATALVGFRVSGSGGGGNDGGGTGSDAGPGGADAGSNGADASGLGSDGGGGGDSGTPDAGSADAGSTSTDGGVPGAARADLGCGCQAPGGALGVALALAGVIARRRPRRFPSQRRRDRSPPSAFET